MKTILLFTSNYRGGILQFTLSLKDKLDDKTNTIYSLIPASSDIIGNANVIKYNKPKSIFLRNRDNIKILNSIHAKKPDIVLFCDDTILSLQLLILLDKDIKKALFIHDVVKHIEYTNVYTYIKHIIKSIYRLCAMKYINKVYLLSNNSYKMFSNKYSKQDFDISIVPLFAHVPEGALLKPKEIHESESNYYLFFGRIDKYKNLILLLNAYCDISKEKIPKLVIAGYGPLTKNECDLINCNSNIILINRFIEDGEMKYLFKHSKALILPYKEASQSGIIPLAFYYNKPVIASNINGLSEFIDDKKTGYLFSYQDGLRDALIAILDNANYESMMRNIRENKKNTIDIRKYFEDFIK